MAGRLGARVNRWNARCSLDSSCASAAEVANMLMVAHNAKIAIVGGRVCLRGQHSNLLLEDRREIDCAFRYDLL